MVRVLDLFCGGGGSSYGARDAGAEIACGVDASSVATSAYKANFPGANAITMTMSDATTPSDLGDIGHIDLILASPECTNHTCARGSRPIEEESRSTARYVLNFASALAPRWIVVENVTRINRWAGYEPLLRELGTLGYKIRVEILNAYDFGVPQARRRVFILADREIMPGQVFGTSGPRPNASDVLDAAGSWISRPLRTARRAPATIARADAGIAKLGKGRPFLIVYYGSDGNGGWQPLDRPLRTVTTLDRFGLVTWEEGTPMLRMLQVSELTRAMGFGDDYCLDMVRVRRDRVRILGNGVCPPVMSAIVRTLQASDAAVGPAEMSSPPVNAAAAAA